jgi:hypothetical protein
MADKQIQLDFGEQDGYRTNVELRGNTPEMFYIWRACDNDTISSAAGKKRMVLADRLAVLAYKLDGDPGDAQLRYVRHAEADKKLTDPAL